MTQFKISVSKPCQENWSEMTSVANGKSCEVCQKHVFDFREKSDAEMVRVFKSNAKQMCGRFNVEQLNRLLDDEETKRKVFWKSLTAAGILTFFGVSDIRGESNNPINMYHEISDTIKTPIRISDTINPNGDSKVDIKVIGKIMDSEEETPVPFANILIQEGQWNGSSDFDGNFSIQIPDSMWGQVVSVKVSFVGYADYIVWLKLTANMNPLKVELKSTCQNIEVMGGAAMAKVSLWQRIKWMFKRK